MEKDESSRLAGGEGQAHGAGIQVPEGPLRSACPHGTEDACLNACVH